MHIFENDVRSPNFKLVLLILFSASLLPGVRIFPGMPAIRLEEAFVFALALPIILQKPYKHTYFDVAMVWIMTAIAFSSAYAVWFLGSDYDFRDFNEYLKPVKYLLIYRLASNIRWTPVRLGQLLNFIVVVGLLCALIGWFQRYNVWNINQSLSPIYAQGSIYVPTTIRVVGTVGNPNHYALLCNLLIILTVTAAFLVQKWSLRFTMVAVAGLLAASVLFSLSKTGSLALIVITAFFVWKTIGRQDISDSKKLIFVLLISAFLFIFFNAVSNKMISLADNAWSEGSVFDRLLLRFQSRDYSTFRTMFGTRYNLWVDALNWFKLSPIFGIGTHHKSFSLLSVYVDNEYFAMLRQYGIFGFIPYLMIYWGGFMTGRRVALKCRFSTSTEPSEGRNKGLVLGEALQNMSLACMVTNMFMGTYFYLQVMPIYVVLSGIVNSIDDRERGTDDVLLSPPYWKIIGR